MTNEIYRAPESNLNVASLGSTTTITLSQLLFSFSGRIGRKLYWLTFLGLVVCIFVLMMLLAVVASPESTLFNVVFVLFYLPIIWVSFAVQIKRWHDRNKSGWWVCISFIPVIGPLWAFIENGCLSGDDFENNYGFPTVFG